MSLLRTAARRLGLGKYRYWKGTDLEGARARLRPVPCPVELMMSLRRGSRVRRQPVL